MKQLFTVVEFITEKREVLKADFYIDSLGGLTCASFMGEEIHIPFCALQYKSLRDLFLAIKKEFEFREAAIRFNLVNSGYAELCEINYEMAFELGSYTLDDYPHECFLLKDANKVIHNLFGGGRVMVKSSSGDNFEIETELFLDYVSARLEAKAEHARLMKR